MGQPGVGVTDVAGEAVLIDCIGVGSAPALAEGVKGSRRETEQKTI